MKKQIKKIKQKIRKASKIWKKIKWNKINYWKIVTYIVFSIIILFAITAILSRFSIGGIKLLTVQSGSMEPSIKTGSVVFVKSQDNYQKGDIITFKNSTNSKETTTHRIIEITTEEDITEIQTKGDANDAPDLRIISNNLIIGKVKFSIPYIGYPVAFVRTLPGLIILIIVPAVMIIYDEILNIKKELAKRKSVPSVGGQRKDKKGKK